MGAACSRDMEDEALLQRRRQHDYVFKLTVEYGHSYSPLERFLLLLSQ